MGSAQLCWRTALFIHSGRVNPKSGWGAAREELLSCCCCSLLGSCYKLCYKASSVVVWEAVQSLVARAWDALSDDHGTAAAICQSAIVGRVLGQLYALRRRQLEWSGDSFAVGAPIHRFLILMPQCVIRYQV